jgi:hypothetical protein
VKVKVKHVVAVFLILLFMLGIVQPFVPLTMAQPNSLVANQSYWLRLASNAWNYYQPGVGVDSTTGLHNAGLDYPYFTDWDLGVYIQTVIDVTQLGILGTSGAWGSDARFSKILTFLETRQLSSSGVPYVWYQSANGDPYGTDVQIAADAGALLVALNNLRVFRPDLAGTINSIVYNYTNYAPLEQAVQTLTSSPSIYDYYVASGFAGFWPSAFSTLASSILNNIVSAPTLSTYGVTLPISDLTCEPLLLSVFNLAPNSELESLAYQVYLAQDAKYNATGEFVAYSEGNTGLDDPSYVYEWIVRSDGSTWEIDSDTGQTNVGISPIIYFKAAVGLLAMYDTTYTENMVSSIASKLPTPSDGYSDGVDDYGRVDTTTIDKTNGMIIAAALYAIDNPPSPTPTPTPTPTPSSTPTRTPTPAPTPTPIPTVSLVLGSTTGGTINPAANTYYYSVGSQVTISATANSSYLFSYWLLNDGSKIYSSTTTLTMSSSKTALAVFAAIPQATPTPTPQVVLVFSSTTGGTISPSANTYTYAVGYQLTISASASNGYSFSYWLFNDGDTIPTSTITLTLTTSMTALAVFTANPVPTPTPAPGATSLPTPAPTPQPTPIPVVTFAPIPAVALAATPEPTPIPIATPTPTLTPTSSSASDSTTPVPSGSVGSSRMNQLVTWLVLLIIVAILVVECLYVLKVVRSRRRNSAKSAVSSQLSRAYLDHRYSLIRVWVGAAFLHWEMKN